MNYVLLNPHNNEIKTFAKKNIVGMLPDLYNNKFGACWPEFVYRILSSHLQRTFTYMKVDGSKTRRSFWNSRYTLEEEQQPDCHDQWLRSDSGVADNLATGFSTSMTWHPFYVHSTKESRKKSFFSDPATKRVGGRIRSWPLRKNKVQL